MKRTLHVISHTHWDREWYLTFQEYRLRLVDLVDRLLDVLDEDPEFRYFHLDGQMIVLEDYLAVRPSQRGRLAKYIQEGRILVGPWYLQNDTFLTSAEATIRNLMIGITMARQWTDSEMKIGYLPDHFGNISQLPQIFDQFGINNAIFGRGYRPDGQNGRSEFWWAGPDGSRIIAVHLANWYNNAQRLPTDPDLTLPILERIIERCERYSTTGHLLLMNGVDHLEAQEDLTEALRAVRPSLPEGTEIIHSTMEQYVARLIEEAPELQVIAGELREGDEYHILNGTLSARTYIKQLSFRNQDLLERNLEPLITWVCANGLAQYPIEHMRFVWKKILENHPHDSICGCSRDAVHATMETRFRETKEVLDELIARYELLLANQIDTQDLEETDRILCVYNTSTQARTAVADAVVDLLAEEGEIGFDIYDVEGFKVPYDVISRKKVGKRTLSPINLPSGIAVERNYIRFRAEHIPPMGYKTYRLIVSKQAENRMSLSAVMADAERPPILENDWLRVIIQDNGSINVTEKRTGTLYENLHLFEDGADYGHSYVHHGLEGETILTTADQQALITCTTDTELEQAYRIEIPWMLPAAIHDDTKQRSRDLLRCVIRTEIKLQKNSAVLSFRTEVDNQVKDHRLRVLFPAPFTDGECRAGGQLDVIRRDHSHRWKRDAQTHPFWRFVDVADDHAGLTIIGNGQHEYEWLKEPDGVAVTLLRAIRSISRRNDEFPDEFGPDIGNQCLGSHVFEYGVLFHDHRVTQASLYLAAEEFANPLKTITHPVSDARWQSGRPWVQGPGVQLFFTRPDPNGSHARLPKTHTFITVSDRSLLISAIKFAENRNSVIVRIWNPETYSVTGTVKCEFETKEAYRTNLLEERESPLSIQHGGGVEVTLAPKQMMTAEFVSAD